MNFNEEMQHKKSENYLIQQLEKGDRNFKILFMSHNAYWPYLERLNMNYENCSAELLGRGTSYIRRTNLNLDDYDFIFYYSSTFYQNEELEKMTEIASRAAKNKMKRVSIGYSYLIPMEDRISQNVSNEIKFVSFKDSIKYENIISTPPYFNPSDLINIVLMMHDDLEKK